MARRQVKVFIDGKEAENTIKNLTTFKKRLVNELRNLNAATEDFEEKEAALVKQIALVNDELDDYRKKVRSTTKDTKAAAGGIGGAFNKLAKGGIAKFAAAAAGAFAVEEIVRYGARLFELGTEMEVLSKKAETVFAEALPSVTEQAEKNAAAMGLTISQYTDAATAIGDLLIPMGFQRQEAADISTELVNLSGALSEWTGGQIKAEEVSRILGKAILGEREELKQLGISINEADVKTRLAEKGLSNLTGELLKQAKAAATLELITERSTDAQNAYANNADTLVRKQAELRARIQDINEALATALIPVFHRLAEIAVPLVNTFADFVKQILSGEKATGKYAGILNLFARRLSNMGKVGLFVFRVFQKVAGFLFDNFGGAIEFVAVQVAKLQNTILGLANNAASLLNIDVTFEKANIADIRKTFEDIRKARLESKVDEPVEPKVEAGSSPISSDKEALLKQASKNKKLKKLREKEAKAEVKALEKKLQQLQQITERYQEAARLAELSEGEKRIEEVRLRYQKEIEIARELEAKGFEEATAQRIELERLQGEAIARVRAEVNEMLNAELDKAIEADVEAELQRRLEAEELIRDYTLSEQARTLLQLEEHYNELRRLAEQYGIDTTTIAAEYNRRKEEINAEFQQKEKEEAQKNADAIIEAERKKLEALATTFNALGSIVGSALQLIGEEAAKNTATGKLLTLIQIGLSTAEGIAKAVAAGAGVPFPGNLVAIASGVAAVTSGIAAARQAFKGVEQRKKGRWLHATGADDHIQYLAEYIGRPGTGMLPDHPVLLNSSSGSPVLASERGSEYFVSHESFEESCGA